MGGRTLEVSKANEIAGKFPAKQTGARRGSPVNASHQERLLQVGRGRFDPLSGELSLDGRTTKLRPRTAALLSHLVRHSDRAVGKDELMQAVWPDAVVTDDSLVQCVKEIRQALGEAGRDWIRTLPRQGYAFVGETAGAVTAAPPVSSPSPRWGNYAAMASFVAAIAAVAFLVAWRAMTPAPPLSIAVMPLVNMTGNPAHEMTADDMTEALTDALARTSGTIVIASATTFTFKGKPIDVRVVGTNLNVRYLLHGSLRMDGATPVLTMRLVDAANSVQLWDHDFRSAGVREMRELVAGRVADTLGIQMLRVSRRGEGSGAASTKGAQLLGRAQRMLRSNVVSAEERTALEYNALSRHEQLQRRGGSMVDAWAQLSATLLSGVRFSPTRDRNLRHAELAVLRALEIGPDHDAAVLAFGKLMYEQGHLEEALPAFERVIELNPNNPHGHGWRGAALLLLGHSAESLTPIDRAIRLSPRDSSLWIWQLFAGSAHLHMGQDGMAIEWLTRSLQGPNPNNFNRPFLASALANAGRIEEAKAEMARFRQRSPGFTISQFRARELSKVPAFLQQRERVYEGLRLAGMPEALPAPALAHKSPAAVAAGRWVGDWYSQTSQNTYEVVVDVKGDRVSGQIRPTNNVAGCSNEWAQFAGFAKGAEVVVAYRRDGRCGRTELTYTIDPAAQIMTGTWVSEWPAHGTFRLTRQAVPLAAAAASAPASPSPAAREGMSR